jgi:hypothetical protein
MAITASGGTAPRGETVSVTYAGGGLTGVTYVTLISPTLGNVACADVSVLTDTTLTFTAPSSGLVHGEILTLAIT